MDVDGVEDNGTARDDDAEIEGAARFGGLGEFFAPWDPALVALVVLALA